MNINPFGDSTIGIARAWLDGLSRRSKAIGDNIANIDTPGYVALEVPFETELRQALSNTGVPLTTTDPRHIAVAPSSTNDMGLQQVQSLVSQRRDGNSVDIDAQMTELAKTQMQYQAAAQAIATKIAILNNALKTS